MDDEGLSEHASDPAHVHPAKHPDARAIAVFATVCCGVAATRFSAHPLLVDVALSLNTTQKHAGFMVALNQLGTVAGLIAFVPLADAHDQRVLSTGLLLLLCLSVFGMAAAPTISILLLMSFCAGIGSSVSHILTPWAVGIAPEKHRGLVVGWMHSGAVAGSLVGMVFAGAIAAAFSWRAVYRSFGCIFAVLILVLSWAKPSIKAIVRQRWRVLALGTVRLLREPALRETSLIGGLLFCSYHIIWLTLGVFLRTPPYHYGSFATSLMASIGLSGLIISPLTGKWMDRFSGTTPLLCSLITVAIAAVVLSWARRTPMALIVGLVLLNMGVRSGQVIAQARIYKANRINYARATTVYMIVYLLGGAIGSGVSSVLWQTYGWQAICLASFVTVSLALIVHLHTSRISEIAGSFGLSQTTETHSIDL